MSDSAKDWQRQDVIVPTRSATTGPEFSAVLEANEDAVQERYPVSPLESLMQQRELLVRRRFVQKPWHRQRQKTKNSTVTWSCLICGAEDPYRLRPLDETDLAGGEEIALACYVGHTQADVAEYGGVSVRTVKRAVAEHRHLYPKFQKPERQQLLEYRARLWFAAHQADEHPERLQLLAR